MTSREIQMGIVQEFLAHYTSGARLGKRVFAEETLIAAGTQVNQHVTSHLAAARWQPPA
jgi:hypothetical protein